MAEQDPTDLKTQERDKAKAERKQALESEVAAEDIKWLMGHKQGRRIAYRQLARAGVWQSSFNTNNAVMSFNEGRRDHGLAFLDQVMAHCPEQYLVMLKEHKAT